MIHPDRIGAEARKKEEENLKFRSYLKGHADEEKLYKEFGVNAELLIDHSWGRESCTIADIKVYKTKTKWPTWQML